MREAGVPAERLRVEKPVLPQRLGLFIRFVLMAPLSIWHYVAFLRQERPDLVHVNGAFDILPALAGRFTGVPVVWHLNDTMFGKKLSLIMGLVVRALATTIIVAGQRVAEHYHVADAGPHVIHAPVDVARFPAKDVSQGLSPTVQLTLIGNWNWVKGQDRFVALIENLVSQGVSVRATIAGHFPDSQKRFWSPILEQVRLCGLSEIIDAPGYLTDTPSLLKRSDILLVTSHSEASPISVLEAMSAGVPVVAFDVGGMREMLGSGNNAAGIWVPEGDVGALSSAVMSIIDAPERWAQMSLNGAERARSYFTLEACVERHKAAYRAAIDTQKMGASGTVEKI